MIMVNGKECNKVNIDEGVFFGKSIFETIMVLDKPIFLKEHIERINNSSQILDIKNRVEETYIEEKIKEYNIKNCILKIVLSDKNIVLTTRENTYTEEIYKQGFKITVGNLIRNSTSILTYIKSTNYIENILQKRKVAKKGFNEVIFLNEEGLITEGSTSNIFFVKDYNVYTPKIECGLLNGVMRKWVLENYDVIEGYYKLQDLYDAEEVFLTNSVMGIMKVSCINKVEFLNQDVTNEILNKYRKEQLKVETMINTQ